MPGKNVYRRPMVLPQSGNIPLGSFSDQTVQRLSFNNPESAGDNTSDVFYYIPFEILKLKWRIFFHSEIDTKLKYLFYDKALK